MNDTSPPAPPPSVKVVVTKRKSMSLMRKLSLLVMLGLLAVVGVFVSFVTPGPLTENKTVIITHGTNIRGIADTLSANNIIYCPLLFRVAAKVIAYNSLQAGEYQFTPRQSVADIVLMMHEGHSVVHKFTVAEGLTSDEIVRLLKASDALTGDVTAIPAEGSLMPETYRYTYGDTRAGMIARMQKGMQEMLADLWANRDPSVGVTSPQEAVVMASVVEKETGKVSERPRIAGVFYNRLHQKMRLQSDPTVIYGITRAQGLMDHDLDHNDLAFPSPYNTYLNDGLPPQPICNPGRAALEAVLHPETNDYLYFVADGTGGHVFARNLAEHNQNVTRWNQLKNKVP